jgi:hypothetical protein
MVQKIKNIIKPYYYAFERFRLVVRRRLGKLRYRLFPPKNKHSYTFAILVIKKTAYADMAIANANSLHALNPTHRFVFYCDMMCANYLGTKKALFDYPNQVEIRDSYGVATKAWQYYKIDVHIDAATNGFIDADADSIWHEDPLLDRTKITMMAYSYDFKDQPREVTILNKLFPDHPEWLNYRHCVAAFLSMPPQFMNDKVAADMRHINDTLFSHALDFLSDEKERGEARRLSEEFAVNLSIQSNWPQDQLVVLKKNGGWGDKEIVQPLYYGCDNQIND